MERLDDQYAFPRGQSVGLEHVGRAKGGQIKLCDVQFVGREAAVVCRGDVVPTHEGLGEILAALELCSGTLRAYHGHAPRRTIAVKVVRDARHERIFGPDDDQVYPLRLHEASERLEISCRQVDIRTQMGRTGVSGRNKELTEARTLRHFPGQRMLAPARSDQQQM